MDLSVIELDNTTFHLIAGGMILAGLLVALTSLLPGSSMGWRVGGFLLGVALAGYGTYALLFADEIFLGVRLFILPVVLIIRSIAAFTKRNSAAVSA